MICVHNWSNSIQKLRERSTSKIADASFALWRFVSLTGKPASEVVAGVGDSGQAGIIRSRLQAFSSSATGRSFTNESINEWK